MNLPKTDCVHFVIQMNAAVSRGDLFERGAYPANTVLRRT